MNIHAKLAQIMVDFFLFKANSVSTYKKCGLSTHIVAVMIILSLFDNILFYVQWQRWNYVVFIFVFRQRKTDDYTLVIYVAIVCFLENYGVGTVNSLGSFVTKRAVEQKKKKKRKGMNTGNENTMNRLF